MVIMYCEHFSLKIIKSMGKVLQTASSSFKSKQRFKQFASNLKSIHLFVAPLHFLSRLRKILLETEPLLNIDLKSVGLDSMSTW